MEDFSFIKLGDTPKAATRLSVTFEYGGHQLTAATVEALLLLTVIEELRAIRAALGKSGE